MAGLKSNLSRRFKSQTLQNCLEKIDFIQVSECMQSIDWNAVGKDLVIKPIRMMNLEPERKRKFSRIK